MILVVFLVSLSRNIASGEAGKVMRFTYVSESIEPRPTLRCSLNMSSPGSTNSKLLKVLKRDVLECGSMRLEERMLTKQRLIRFFFRDFLTGERVHEK